MAYKAPIWEDGKSPAISAENLNNLSKAAEGAQVLYGNSAPTSSTEGAVGQFYLVVVADSDGNYPLYQCVAIANGSYTWRDTRRIPDSITSMLGIPAPGTINRALNVLANVGNLHVWKRVRILSEPIYKPVQSDVNTSITLEPGDILYYSSGVDVVGLEESDISLSEPVSSFSYNGSNFPDVVGKYIRKYGSDLVYYYPTSDQNIAGTTLWIRGCKKINATIDTPAGTTTDYLTSTDRNAYPDKSAEGGQDAYYTLGDVVSGTIVPATTSQVQFKCSTAVTVYDNGDLNVDGGVVNLQNYNTEGTSAIKGKYIVPVTTGASISGVWFISSDATFSLISVDGDATKRYLYCDKMQPVTGHAAIQAGTTITYLGQLGEPGAKIEVGSYVGTGTNQNTIPSKIKPLVLFLDSSVANANSTYVITLENTYVRNQFSASWADDSITLTTRSDQSNGTGHNKSGTSYDYTIIGI